MSMALVLLGNVAYRTGRTLEFDGNSELCIGNEEANKSTQGVALGCHIEPLRG